MASVAAFLLLLGFFALLFTLFAWAARMSKLVAGNIRQAADSLGLEYTSKPPTLGFFYTEPRASGQMRGKRVQLFPFSTGSGKSRTQWCAVSAAVPNGTALTFQLRQQGWGSKFMELFGAREIQVGDDAFDRAWFIQTNQPEFFREALLPELREKISAVVRAPGATPRGVEFKLENGVVRYAEIGSFANAGSCQRCIQAADVVCDLADLAEVFAEQKAGN